MKTRNLLIGLAGFIILAGLSTGCAKNPTAPQATMQVQMTANGALSAQQVTIQALPTSGTANYTPENFIVDLKKIEISQNGSSWESIWQGETQFDIATGQVLDPMNGPVVLPEGDYHGIRFTIGDNITGQVHVDGDLHAGTLTNYEGEHIFTTVNGKLDKAISITGTNASTVTFSFDVTNTLNYEAATDRWSLLKPISTASVE